MLKTQPPLPTALAVLALIVVPGCHPSQKQAPADSSSSDSGFLAYFGTYTNGDSRGIYVSRFHPSNGQMTRLELAAEAIHPSFLAVHPSHGTLYAVQEDAAGQGLVGAYRVDRSTGHLDLLNRQSAMGAGPCHVNVDASGRVLVIANYRSGSTVSFPLREDGSLGEAASIIRHTGSSVNERRQSSPHAHSVSFSPDSRFVISADLGTDQLLIYRVDPRYATLEPHTSAGVSPGGGPRHFTFHPSGRYGYVINEMGGTVTAFEYDAEPGTLREIQTISTLPPDFEGQNTTAEVRVHPSGKFLYGSNRGHDSIAVFSIDESDGRLAAVERVPTGGRTPRNFNLDPTGRYLLAENQASDNVVIFRIDSTSGRLQATGQVLAIPSPVCLRFVPR